MSISGKHAILENGQTVQLEENMHNNIGDYVRMQGVAIVDTLSKQDGDSIRKLIAELNTPYEQE